MGYDAGLVLFAAMENGKSLSAADTRNALAATKDFQAVTGKITIDAKRNASKYDVNIDNPNSYNPLASHSTATLDNLKLKSLGKEDMPKSEELVGGAIEHLFGKAKAKTPLDPQREEIRKQLNRYFHESMPKNKIGGMICKMFADPL
jgi:hypothetical protein